ncbi:LytTR family transcriptional regulator DNA-binding domain-containing protein [Ihubacter sp. rT4E-8]|uniref:LytTR family transcriptional regulator DNA-binding domain-containing protein n=1 Tax=unclassified Ihubacter TaxID=2633299 RepID=UPI00137A0FFC
MAEKYLPIISGAVSARIKLSDVVLIERKNRKLHVMTEGHDFDYYEKIENIEPILDGRFYPCLKGCYINMERVEAMAEQSIYFDNGEQFALGRDNFVKAKRTYKHFLQKKGEMQK